MTNTAWIKDVLRYGEGLSIKLKEDKSFERELSFIGTIRIEQQVTDVMESGLTVEDIIRDLDSVNGKGNKGNSSQHSKIPDNWSPPK